MIVLQNQLKSDIYKYLICLVLGALISYYLSYNYYTAKILELELKVQMFNYKALEDYGLLKDKISAEMLKNTKEFNTKVTESNNRLDALSKRISGVRLVTIDGCKPSEEFKNIWNSTNMPR